MADYNRPCVWCYMSTGEKADRIIYSSLAVLFIFGIASFFCNPAYEKGVWVVIDSAKTALTGSLAFKFGITVPKPSELEVPNSKEQI